MSRLLLAATVLFVSGGCLGPDDATDLHLNTPPAAALRTPVIAPVGRAVRLDASQSFDGDADPLTYVFQINGGESISSAEPVLSYVFATAGIYTVSVRVIDLHGDEALARQDVTTITEYPDPPDFCDATLPCVVGDECRDGVCYSTGGALE